MATATKTVKEQVLSLLKRKWITNSQLEEMLGTSAPRRARELRAEGFNVTRRFNEVLGEFQYRIPRG